MTSIFKVIFVGEPCSITRKDGSEAVKQSITIREIGGKYDNHFVATWIGNSMCNLAPGSTIAAALRFSVRNYEGQDYQDIVLQEYVPISTPIKLPSLAPIA